jgi:ferredoxin-type protein NapH
VRRTARNLSLRRKVQWGSLILANSYFLTTFRAACMPGLNCYMCPAAAFMCPIGIILQCATAAVIPFMAIGVLALIGVAVGRLACGWLCPFGLLQELMFKIRSRKLHLPPPLAYTRYALLIALVIAVPLALRAEDHWAYYCSLCPLGTLEGTVPAMVGHHVLPHLSEKTQADILAKSSADPQDEPRQYFYLALSSFTYGRMVWVKLGILGAILLLMVFIKRPFCRMFCPLGAIWSVFNQASWLRLKLRGLSCPTCEMCRELCPVDINVSDKLNSAECIRCLDCLECPHVQTTT